MQYRTTIDVLPRFINDFQKGEESAKTAIEMLLVQSEELVCMLTNYHCADRGEVCDGDVTIMDEDDITINNIYSAYVHIDYTCHFRFGCDDMDNDKELSMELEIRIDSVSKTMTIIGADIPERYTDDL